MYRNTPRDTTSGEYVIKTPRFDSGILEEWIIFVNLVQKSLVGQNITTGTPMHKCMERMLKGDTKAIFLQTANLVCIHIVAKFTIIVATVNVNIFLTYKYHDQKQYRQRYLRKPSDMKVQVFITRFVKLNTRLLYFLPDHPFQLVASLRDDDINKILKLTMPNSWKKKNVE